MNSYLNFSYGIYADNSDVTIKWCRIKNNGYDGVRHIGFGKSITIENCQIYDNRQYGLYLDGSVSIVKNNVVCGNGIENINYFGIRIKDPSAVPVVYNNTITYNYNEAISYADTDPNLINRPDVQNCIIYYNNDEVEGKRQMVNVWPSQIQFSCLQDDPNDPTGESTNIDNYSNFSHKPGFAYTYANEPNVLLNIHLAYDSFCKDKGNTVLSYAGQFDMDGEGRVYNNIVDIGADEVDCEDVYHPLDWNADGLVNMDEFYYFAKAWLSRDPNDPVLLADPNLVDPNEIRNWDERCNLNASGNSQYYIDLADFISFCPDWLWVACWKEAQLASELMAIGAPENTLYAESLLTVKNIAVAEESVELSTVEQFIQAKEAIDFFEKLWKTNPEVRKTIDKKEWESFMDELYKMLNSLDKFFENSL